MVKKLWGFKPQCVSVKSKIEMNVICDGLCIANFPTL